MKLTRDKRVAEAVRRVEDALAAYVPGCDSFADVERPKLALADAVLRALTPRPAKATLRQARRKRA